VTCASTICSSASFEVDAAAAQPPGPVLGDWGVRMFVRAGARPGRAAGGRYRQRCHSVLRGCVSGTAHEGAAGGRAAPGGLASFAGAAGAGQVGVALAARAGSHAGALPAGGGRGLSAQCRRLVAGLECFHNDVLVTLLGAQSGLGVDPDQLDAIIDLYDLE